MNIRDRSAIHDTAGQSLRNAKGDPKRILLIYLAIVTALSLAVAALSIILSNRIEQTGGLSNMGLRSVLSTAKTVLPLIQSLVFLGLEMGYCTMALRICRGESVSEQTLWSGFHRFFPLLRAQLLLGFLYLGVALLAVYPSAYIFLMLPMSAEFYEVISPLMDTAAAQGGSFVVNDAMVLAASDAMMPMLWIFALLFLLLFIPMHYRYRMMTYRLIDQPRPGALRAMHESRMMMRRNRFALFRLDLQFWWFYLLQVLIMAVCYGDMLLPALGVTFPWSDTVSYFLFLALSLVLQFVVYYFSMNRVAVTYATAYEALQPKQQKAPDAPQPTAVPWQNQY